MDKIEIIMQNEILVLRAEIEEKVKLIANAAELETFRFEYLVKKGKSKAISIG